MSEELKARYTVYRCFPNMTETGTPWFREFDYCPCNEKYDNLSGRGYVSCPFGVQADDKVVFKAGKQMSQPPGRVGAWVQDSQWVPPQLSPRPLSRIGEQWRSAN